eukprot:GHVR01058457.1.p1 GENE.GHVR01058457.1~~GHVR01058457.1.p1  ORF type:complete len:333 (-),score=100.27 GHVR01058457.1:270-1268(-)
MAITIRIVPPIEEDSRPLLHHTTKEKSTHDDTKKKEQKYLNENNTNDCEVHSNEVVDVPIINITSNTNINEKHPTDYSNDSIQLKPSFGVSALPRPKHYSAPIDDNVTVMSHVPFLTKSKPQGVQRRAPPMPSQAAIEVPSELLNYKLPSTRPSLAFATQLPGRKKNEGVVGDNIKNCNINRSIDNNNINITNNNNNININNVYQIGGKHRNTPPRKHTRNHTNNHKNTQPPPCVESSRVKHLPGHNRKQGVDMCVDAVVYPEGVCVERGRQSGQSSPASTWATYSPTGSTNKRIHTHTNTHTHKDTKNHTVKEKFKQNHNLGVVRSAASRM